MKGTGQYWNKMQRAILKLKAGGHNEINGTVELGGNYIIKRNDNFSVNESNTATWDNQEIKIEDNDSVNKSTEKDIIFESTEEGAIRFKQNM